jgi:hypothetical protein
MPQENGRIRKDFFEQKLAKFAKPKAWIAEWAKGIAARKL